MKHNKTDAFVAVATSPALSLPRTVRPPINRCNLLPGMLQGEDEYAVIGGL